jgi:murein DD-endopeptidase MepM/ murein hydrolase activator NlpD
MSSGHDLPGFVLPTLAAAGAVLIVRALARSLIRLAHASRSDRRLSVIPVIVNVVATLVLVISPAARLLAVAMTTNDGPPHTLAGFGDWRGSEGYPLLSAHRGVDLAARPGSDVLAAADGRVVVARDSGGACGLILVIVHDRYDYRTVYCHLASFGVGVGQRVSRGERVGAVGTTGQRAWPGYEHVHLELQHGGSPNDLEDPASRFAGCFDSARTYPTDRLRLTYPVRC